jgi:S1-C subfamily serine protease
MARGLFIADPYRNILHQTRCVKERDMADETHDPLAQISDALATRAEAAQAFIVAIRARHHFRSGMLWGGDVVVASEQVFPRANEAEIRLADGRDLKAKVAGRDPGTNVVALRLEQPVEVTLPQSAETRLGALALAVGATAGGTPSVRLGVVRFLGPAWHSLAGGLIDRRIGLDFAISGREEGGPVLAASGGLLGMSTAGPRGQGLVIPASTIERVLGPLLATGRVERGWLGVALHPVALGEPVAAQEGADRGLMVMQVTSDGPAARAGIHAGDILVRIGQVPAIDPHQISHALGPESIGHDVALRLVRAGSPLTVAVTVTARPAR